jgi:hypothetical protein
MAAAAGFWNLRTHALFQRRLAPSLKVVLLGSVRHSPIAGVVALPLELWLLIFGWLPTATILPPPLPPRLLRMLRKATKLEHPLPPHPFEPALATVEVVSGVRASTRRSGSGGVEADRVVDLNDLFD